MKEIRVLGSIRTGDATDGSTTGGSGYEGSAKATTNVFVETGKAVKDFLDDFDASKMSYVSRDDFLHVVLAPSYGWLSVESVKHMDTNLKVMIDSDIIATTPTPITSLAEIVAWSGATIAGFESAFYKTERHEKTVVYIGILRFPDLHAPIFQGIPHQTQGIVTV
ncbi:hypothetical protein F5X99DRAFT_413778 [Biscogniauxia marginata]|nr:hypothetical protein F5X99DRAFT_413778 [Biscogniauxia marginata]